MRALSESVDLGGGRRATYEIVGAGEPLLYFQGGPGFSANLLRDDAQLLADRFAVHLIDPHGSGGSTPPTEPSHYDHIGHARFYDEVRAALGIRRATVMGISFGSIVALTYAALFPDAAARCIAVSTRVVGEEEAGADAEDEMERMLARHAEADWYPAARATWDAWTERVLAATDAAAVDAMMAEVLPLYMAHPERPRARSLIDAWRRDAQSDLAAAKAWEGGLWQTIDARPLLGRIRCPTLVLSGELDMICGPTHGRMVADAVADAELVVLPDSGHFIPAEAPDAFHAAVLAFADRTAAATTGDEVAGTL